MHQDEKSFSGARRRVLAFFGLGAAGAAAGAVAGADRLFAKQFAEPAARLQLPPMTYDPELQMMVDPVTQAPVYPGGPKIQVATAVVTTGCSNCPKNDGCKDNYAC